MLSEYDTEQLIIRNNLIVFLSKWFFCRTQLYTLVVDWFQYDFFWKIWFYRKNTAAALCIGRTRDMHGLKGNSFNSSHECCPSSATWWFRAWPGTGCKVAIWWAIWRLILPPGARMPLPNHFVLPINDIILIVSRRIAVASRGFCVGKPVSFSSISNSVRHGATHDNR